MKWIFTALLFLSSTAFAAPEFKPTDSINVCVFGNGIALPCFMAEMKGQEVLVVLDERGKVLAIAEVKNGEVVKILWQIGWIES